MDLLQLQDLLLHADWMSNFDTRTLDRAHDYVLRDKVLELTLHGDDGASCVLAGQVSGSGRRTYTCRIGIETHDRWLTLDTDCSCPVGIDCKHAAAMLLLAMDEPVPRTHTSDRAPAVLPASTPAGFTQLARQTSAPPAMDAMQTWERWFDSLQPESADARVAAPERRFGLLLRAGDHAPGFTAPLLACPAWLRPSKSRAHVSGLVDPQPLQLDARHGPLPVPADGWPDHSAMALATLLGCRSTRISNLAWFTIQARHEEQALEHLLEHHPAWFERGQNRLQRDTDRPLQLYWHEAEDGNQQLAAGVSGAALLLRGAGLWYVQPDTLRYGRVDGDARLLERLRYAPTLAPEQVTPWRERQRTLAPDHPLPAPIERDPPQPLEVEPVPVLHMRVVVAPNWHGGVHRIGMGRLRFDYDGLPFEPQYDTGSVQRRLYLGRLFDVRRDFTAEVSALHLLQEHGGLSANHLREFILAPQQTVAHDFALQPQTRKPPLKPEDCQPLLAELVRGGFVIEYDDDFPHDQVLDIDAWHADLETSGEAWFDVSLGIDVDGQRIDLLPLLRRTLADPDFPRTPRRGENKHATYRVRIDDTRCVEIPLKRLRALIEPLLEWLEGDDKLRMHRSQAPALQALADDAQLTWQGGEALRRQLTLLNSAKRSTRAPRGFKATLRPYQREGLAWLDFLGTVELGGILADDMGLGKTVQVLAHIVSARQRKQLDAPVLVVAPTSLVGNWRDEAARFAPRLKVLVIHGADRADHYDDIADHHLVITTYPLLPRDRDKLLDARFSLLVLDEAQAIKNPRSQAAQVVREIPAARRLAMTGTPLENHLGELWAQFDAVEPGLLGSRQQFTRRYRTPIEKHADSDRQQRLNRRVGPLLLRRRKDQVLTDLPAKNEIVRTLELEGDQRALYEALRLAQHQRVQQTIRERGLAQSGIIVLDALLKLRQACCDPRLVKLDSAKKVNTSVKLDALLELVDGLVGEGRRILLFSQFTEMLGLIEAALNKRRIEHLTLTGQTPGPQRGALVKRFQKGDMPVFLISLKAGGTGLNLTAADTVIHYDPWWNPAVEAQATDRAHRIGQNKPVFVYRLVCTGTVEEKIQAMQARKAELARAVLEGGTSQRLRFDEADLTELFAPL